MAQPLSAMREFTGREPEAIRREVLASGRPAVLRGLVGDWPAVAAATTLFVIPIVLFTILLRKHLLRGITFGAVRK